ncbi:NIPSNAP family protein [Pontibacter sp. E15-1]|uniref:NIPSNAP family protein n=1 Tax=Pontibacter sp. E15-1 TaxID=2919918 RepID=UPI001F4F9C6E|nr:NIPSNAP family protein [Pontibacter sp. E15-1]MCJ8167335.1 NIPSNAP family protein [Pontibacter sp. E15-1]
MKKSYFFALCLLVLWAVAAVPALSQGTKPGFYALKVFHLKDQSQEERLDQYLQNAYLPALHRAGVAKVGVFKPVAPTKATAADSAEKLVYVFIPFTAAEQFFKLDEKLAKDKQYATAGKDYLGAPFDKPLYSRFETTLIEAFAGMPGIFSPKLSSSPAERVYELRSYESASEKLHLNKVSMFNNGEIDIFKKLNFNAVFYGRVLAGDKMPNLIYMTSFENMAERDKKWKAFGQDPDWKTLSAKPEYANNMQHADIYLLHPTAYSDL